MKYKVGDRVRIKSLDWYNENKNKFGKIWTVCLSGEGTICFDQDCAKYCGKEVTIFSVEPDNYVLRGIPYAWTDEMIEGLAEEEEIEFTEEDKYWCDIMSESDPTTYVLPQGYQFKDENGNVINATKIVLEKKEKSYPKTYEECCYVLGFENTEMVFEDDYRDIIPPKEQWKRLGLMNQLNKLLICRDAYWKIAGEEMGLGKPWEPDFGNLSTNLEYIKIVKGCFTYSSRVFAFPTEEMRDSFKENFDPDIEICKELL